MVAALRWVRNNAAAFGGDPDKVTIFGQSGGGAKVMALLAAPAATGLFHRAISESCSGSLRITGQEEATQLAAGTAKGLGLPRLTGEELQSVPMEQLIAAARGFFRPILDRRTFTRHPYDPDAPPTSVAIPLMAGNVATETRAQMAENPKNFDLDLPEVRRRLSRFLRINDIETDGILDAYQTSSPSYSPINTPSDLLAAVATDYSYIRNTRRGATLQSMHAPAYSYIFTRRTPVMDGLLRAPHESEVPFVFGTPGTTPQMVGTGSDIAPLTKIMIATWSAFARNGNPENPAIPAWPRHDAQNGFSMMLNVHSSIERNPGGEARAALDPLPFYEYSMPANYTRT
jgi:para-nitrobenzyl esterase